MNFVAPIMVEGRQIGAMLGGQVLPQPHEEEKFWKIAEEIGIDPSNYVNALQKIRIRS